MRSWALRRSSVLLERNDRSWRRSTPDTTPSWRPRGRARRPVLVLTPGLARPRTWPRGRRLPRSRRVALLPAWDALPYEGMDPAPEVAARRADAIGRLRGASGPFVVVAPYLAAMQRIPPTLGTARPVQLAAGVELAPDALAERLSELGYARVDVVEHRGEFAVRGGVVDVFPGIARRPARVEYWGDEIERLREFSPSTQLSTKQLGASRSRPSASSCSTMTSARSPRPAPRACPTGSRDGMQRLADGLRFEAGHAHRSCSIGCRRPASCSRPGAGWP